MKKMKNWAILLLILTTAALMQSCSNDELSVEENANILSKEKNGALSPPTGGDYLPVIVDQSVTPCGETKTVDLWAGQDIDAGSITIYNDNVNLYVTVYSDSGYQTGTEQIKMWVGGDLANLPRNPSGNPQIGQFPYKIDTGQETTYTFTIPLDNLSLVNECGDLIYVVVHADVLADDGQGGTTAETAFGGDTDGDTGDRWWYYTTYEIQCCDTPTQFDHSETAFAKGGWVFASQNKANPESLQSLELTRMRWGWAINLDADGETTYDIWAGAGLNDTYKGIKVGTLTVIISGTDVTVTYNLDSGYYLSEVHIYVGDLAPTTIAPGQYGHTEYFDPVVDNYSNTFSGIADTDDDGIWIIAHAVVNW